MVVLPDASGMNRREILVILYCRCRLGERKYTLYCYAVAAEGASVLFVPDKAKNNVNYTEHLKFRSGDFRADR